MVDLVVNLAVGGSAVRKHGHLSPIFQSRNGVTGAGRWRDRQIYYAMNTKFTMP